MSLIWLLLVPLYIFIDSAVSLHQLERIYKEYFLWLSDSRTHNVAEKRSKLKSLIAHANIPDAKIPVTQPVGFSYVAHATVSVLENFPSQRADIAECLLSLINDAIGVYKDRMWNAFNPLWWINTLIFLPRSICTYLNVKADSLFVKMGQLMWWAVGTAFAVYKLLFPDNLTHLLEELYHTLLP